MYFRLLRLLYLQSSGLCTILSLSSLVANVSALRFPVLLDFSLTVKAATLIFISGCGSAISSAKQGKSGFIYNLVKS